MTQTAATKLPPIPIRADHSDGSSTAVLEPMLVTGYPEEQLPS